MGKGSHIGFGLKFGRACIALALSISLFSPATHARPVRASMTPPIGSFGPTLTAISPASALIGSRSLQLTVSGSHFGAGAKVRWNGAALATVRKSSDTLVATVPAADLAAAALVNVTVSDLTIVSHAAVFTVANPAPVLASVSPASFYVLQGDATLTLAGSGFVPGSTVYWDGAALTTTYLSSTSLTVVAPASLFAGPGLITADVTVGNVSPGGGLSGAIRVADAYAVPQLIQADRRFTAGAGDQTVDLYVAGVGPGPVPSDAFTIDWNGHPLPAYSAGTYFPGDGTSDVILSATVPAGYLANEGTAQLAVTDSSGTSNAIPAYVVGATLSLASADPEVDYGSAAYTLTLTGTGFPPDGWTWILWNGVARSVTYVSPTELQLQVPAADVATPGTVTLQVRKLIRFHHGPVYTYSNTLDYVIHGTKVTTLTQQANTFVWDESRQLLYASTWKDVNTGVAGIVKIDPVTGSVTTAINTGSAVPYVLALADDDSYLYAGYNSPLPSNGTHPSHIQRFALPDMASDLDFEATGPIDPLSQDPQVIAVQPGEPSTIAVLWSPSHLDDDSPPSVTYPEVYDDGVQRPNNEWLFSVALPYTYGDLTWNATGDKLFMGDSISTPGSLMILDVSPAGLVMEKGYPGIVPEFYHRQGFHLDPATGYVFTDSGKVLDPATGGVIGQLTRPGAVAGEDHAQKLLLDATAGRAYVLYTIYDAASQHFTEELVAFDLTTLAAVDTLDMPTIRWSGYTAMARWHDDGLAVSGYLDGKDVIVLIQGDFVH